MRVVNSGDVFAASVREGDALELFVHSLSSPAVVTRAPLNVGDTVAYGTFLGSVSGAPFFAVPGPLPLYRDLGIGAEGDDVLAFQEALQASGVAVSVSGTIDWVTYSAIKELFESQGTTLDWGSPIPYRQFLSVPSKSGTVTATAALGTVLDESTPLQSIAVSPRYVYLRADAIVGASLAIGDLLRVQVGADTFDAAVAKIGDFGAGTDGQPPGRDIELSSADKVLANAQPGTPATVSTNRDQGDPLLAVPVTSLRRDDAGDYVERELVTDGKVTFERVAVTVIQSGEGWAAIEGSVAVGDSVRVY